MECQEVGDVAHNIGLSTSAHKAVQAKGSQPHPGVPCMDALSQKKEQGIVSLMFKI